MRGSNIDMVVCCYERSDHVSLQGFNVLLIKGLYEGTIEVSLAMMKESLLAEVAASRIFFLARSDTPRRRLHILNEP